MLYSVYFVCFVANVMVCYFTFPILSSAENLGLGVICLVCYNLCYMSLAFVLVCSVFKSVKCVNFLFRKSANFCLHTCIVKVLSKA